MKTFKQHISESGVKTAAAVGTTVDGQSVEDSQIGAHNIQDEDVLKVVNGFVGSIKPYRDFQDEVCNWLVKN